MKCPSVASLWPAAPPPHCVTAAAVLPHSSALYTGGSDGSVVWWDLSASAEIRPVGILCGHAAAIADLAACAGAVPGAASSVLSACVAGVLCVWSGGGGGRCRRRRKLPPWAGAPALLSPLPSSPRHVCVFCSSTEPGGHHLSEAGAPDGEPHTRRPAKCAVLIVDSCNLNVVQTVFHGSLSVGPPKAMAVTSVVEDGGENKQQVILVDGHGRVQLVAVSESDNDGQSGSLSCASSSSDMVTALSGNDPDEWIQALAVSKDGKLLALVFGSRCLLKRAADGVTVGEISFLGTSLCKTDSSSKVQLTGAIFLHSGKSGGGNLDDETGRSLALWNTNGAAVLYRVSISPTSFNFEPFCEIPAVPSEPNRQSFHFCQFNSCLIRVESHSFTSRGSLLWSPRISKWPVEQVESSIIDNLATHYVRRKLAEGGFPEHFRTLHSECVNETTEVTGNETTEVTRKSLQQNSSVDSFSSNVALEESGCNGLSMNQRIVSSSMVLSGDSYAPYAVVYGFYSGEIEVIRFANIFPEVNFSDLGGIYPHISEKFFSGHTGAVLCLALHHMDRRSGEQSPIRLLISGSLDCTVRIWDLDTGHLHTVLHHHVASVRQIILPPPWTPHPWDDCFLSVGDDDCVALVSLETLRVERVFPGHPSFPSMVAWDSTKGYIACLCRNLESVNDTVSVLYLWDVKTGARERIICGTASQLVFDHFCQGINKNNITGNILGVTTSASRLLIPVFKDASFSPPHAQKNGKALAKVSSADSNHSVSMETLYFNTSIAQNSKEKAPVQGAAHDIGNDTFNNSSAKYAFSQKIHQKKKLPVRSSCPLPGIACLRFDLSAVMSPVDMPNSGNKEGKVHVNSEEVTFQHGSVHDKFDGEVLGSPSKESLEGRLLRFSLCFLHLWSVDHELDKLLTDEMDVCKPEGCHIAVGVPGNRGSLTLMFPGLQATLELWKSSSEFCAMRSLTLVSLAQRMISLSRSCRNASSALAAFYTRNFAEKVPDIKHPSLQLLVSFWQHPCEHVRMAARSLFHCAAPRAIPHPLRVKKIKTTDVPSSPLDLAEFGAISTTSNGESKNDTDEIETSTIISWLDSFEYPEWVSWIGGTSQDTMASNIIVAAALVVWYPSIVKDQLANIVINRLIKLVMSMNDRYSSTAAELLAEGMESAWKSCLGTQVTHFIGDIFFQIECLSSGSSSNMIQNSANAVAMREALVEILLPSLAMADIMGYFGVIEGQIWGTSSDSPVHLVSLKTLIRVVRGSPKILAPYIDKVVHYVLQTMDPSNLVMRKTCLSTSMIALREIARVFPMVALNESSTRLAVGDAIGDIHKTTIRVYDITSVTKIRILDASGPPGLPSLLEEASSTRTTIAISALTFSPDGEGLVAFSENGLMIRWWSLGSAWWERLGRSLVPVQCTKLIYVPPWEGFSPNSSRLSIMMSILGHDKHANSEATTKELNDADNLKLLIHNLDLSYRLQWIEGRTIKLTRHGQELGTFQL